MARKHRDVMRILIAEIVSGTRRAGDMLPREVDLAAEFEVSRAGASGRSDARGGEQSRGRPPRQPRTERAKAPGGATPSPRRGTSVPSYRVPARPDPARSFDAMKARHERSAGVADVLVVDRPDGDDRARRL
jgi:DNA-binding transcriptional MocR family regulator